MHILEAREHSRLSQRAHCARANRRNSQTAATLGRSLCESDNNKSTIEKKQTKHTVMYSRHLATTCRGARRLEKGTRPRRRSPSSDSTHQSLANIARKLNHTKKKRIVKTQCTRTRPRSSPRHCVCACLPLAERCVGHSINVATPLSMNGFKTLRYLSLLSFE